MQYHLWFIRHRCEMCAGQLRNGFAVLVPLILGCLHSLICSNSLHAADGAPVEDLAPVVQAVDRLLEAHWQGQKVTPAAPADDATLLRRVMLDLAGRIPTVRSARAFAADKSPEKFARVVQQLAEEPEFDLHFATVLDEAVQGRHAGHAEFVDYLRRSLRQRTSWDALFRELLVGPWDGAERKVASRFLSQRAKQLDVLAVDTSRAFFGVDISCAKCHDHPLAPDWTQDHFYGMVAFLNRTTSGDGKVGEKSDGEVKFLARDGKERTAPMMFLSGQKVDEPALDKSKPAPASPFSRRGQLVQVALEQKAFFRKSFVNRVWEYLFGRGLVHPVDQMHSANPAAVPELLDFLAQDFGEHGYDIRRLVTVLVLSREYRLASEWPSESPAPPPEQFAVARLRPLSPRQLAFSLLIALGDETPDRAAGEQTRVERVLGVSGIARIEWYLALEQQSAELIPELDPRTSDFQTSVREALFVSNAPNLNRLATATEANLAGRLSKISEPAPLIEAAFQAVLSRPPTAEEITITTTWLAEQGADRKQACKQLVWSLATSAEFRFNH